MIVSVHKLWTNLPWISCPLRLNSSSSTCFICALAAIILQLVAMKCQRTSDGGFAYSDGFRNNRSIKQPRKDVDSEVIKTRKGRKEKTDTRTLPTMKERKMTQETREKD